MAIKERHWQQGCSPVGCLKNVGKFVDPTKLKKGIAAKGEAKKPESKTLFLTRALP